MLNFICSIAFFHGFNIRIIVCATFVLFFIVIFISFAFSWSIDSFTNFSITILNCINLIILFNPLNYFEASSSLPTLAIFAIALVVFICMFCNSVITWRNSTVRFEFFCLALIFFLFIDYVESSNNSFRANFECFLPSLTFFISLICSVSIVL